MGYGIINLNSIIGLSRWADRKFEDKESGGSQGVKGARLKISSVEVRGFKSLLPHISPKAFPTLFITVAILLLS